MTDDTTLQTDEQLANEQAIDPNKRTFFGGEINFNDPDVVKPVDMPEALPTEEDSPVEEGVLEEDVLEEEDISEEDVSEEQPTEQQPEQPTEHRTDNLPTSPTTDEKKAEDTVAEPENEEMFDPFDEDDDNESHNEPHNEPRRDASLTRPNGEAVPHTDNEPLNNNEPLNDTEPSNDDEPSHNPNQPTIEKPTKPNSGSNLIDKFLNLTTIAKNIFSLSEDKQSFNILGNKNDKSTLEYFIYLVEDEENHLDLFIKKVETNTITDVEDEHLLQRSYNTSTQTLDIFVDEILLYQFPSSINTTEITTKLEKFWFLFETYYQDLNKAIQEKKEAESKKKQLHEIFRNF